MQLRTFPAALPVVASLLAAGSLTGGASLALPAPAAAQIRPAATQLRPAAAPWQQGIEYRIEARLDETDEVLRGRARVRYRNESPNTLTDFYLHLHLNAFRPNSAWARRDLENGITTFQDLGPEEHAFERLREMRAGGEVVRLVYPHAPDSTVVGFRLPEPLEPGESVTLDYAWDARPSTVPRRQGRRGRQFDFAQWYPRVVPYDELGWRPHPLYRQGEFHGEFATYDVTLEVREDQVIGATGVPVEGDPGWDAAAALGTGPVAYQRDWYGSPPAESLGHLTGEPPAGHKRVRWHAEDVHHFAWSTSPEYIYEQGIWEDVVIHVLYRPGDEETWGRGTAVRRTATALQWLDGIFGDYAYPQVTNLHRIEGGGTEFPMVIMDGSASQGLILHEVGHIYAHGILANNEWYEGWLDEGLSSFQTSWFSEEAGAGDEVWRGSQIGIIDRALRGLEEPVVQPAEDFSSYGTYGAMVYTKGSLVFLMLREIAGEERFREILRTYYDRYRLRHVDSEIFESVAEDVLGTELDWFFDQWLYGEGVVDYALREVDVRREGSQWLVGVQVERVGDLRMPVPVRLRGGDGETVDVRLEGVDPVERVTVRTDFRPENAELDPDGAILDWNVRNNHWPGGPFSMAARSFRLANPLEPVETRWREIPVEVFPLLWFNDAGGWVGGVQLRSAQLGWISRTLLRIGLPAVEAGDRGAVGDHTDFGSLHLRIETPVMGGRPRPARSLEVFAGEGRWLVDAEFGGGSAGAGSPGGSVSFGGFGRVYGIYEEAYLVPGRWSTSGPAGVPGSVGGRTALELGVRGGRLLGGADPWTARVFAAGGLDDADHVWVRGGAELSSLRMTDGGWLLAGRLFAGGALGKNPGDPRYEESWASDFVPRERMFFLAGADPLETLSNPWIRSAGAPLDLEGRMPGGGNLPGFHPGLPLPQMLAASVEVGLPALDVGVGDDRVEVRPVGFAGVAAGGQTPLFDAPVPVQAFRESLRAFYSAGAGLEVGMAGSPLRVRLDVPFLVSEPGAANRESQERLDARWAVTIIRR